MAAMAVGDRQALFASGLVGVVQDRRPDLGAHPPVATWPEPLALRRAGQRVTEARDGAAALAKLQADPPDLLVTDVRMPRLEGGALLRAARPAAGPAGGAGVRPRRRGRAPVRAGEGETRFHAKPVSAHALCATVADMPREH